MAFYEVPRGHVRKRRRAERDREASAENMGRLRGDGQGGHEKGLIR